MRMRRTGHVAFRAEIKNVYKILVGKPEGERPLRWKEKLQVTNPSHSVKEDELGIRRIFVKF
jgi:hypothetical protein